MENETIIKNVGTFEAGTINQLVEKHFLKDLKGWSSFNFYQDMILVSPDKKNYVYDYKVSPKSKETVVFLKPIKDVSIDEIYNAKKSLKRLAQFARQFGLYGLEPDPFYTQI